MTASTIDMNNALTGLGRRLDHLAMARADERVLDGLLAAMGQIHDGIIEHLATTIGTAHPMSTHRRRSGRTRLYSVAS